MQKSKRKRAVFLALFMVVAAALVLALCIVIRLRSFFNPAAPLAKEQTINTQSFDGKLTLIEEHRRVSGVMMAQISVCDETGETVFTCPEDYRIWDYYGTFWGGGTYDIWTLSSDVGMFRYIYGNGGWQKTCPQMPLPENAPQEAKEYIQRITH